MVCFKYPPTLSDRSERKGEVVPLVRLTPRVSPLEETTIYLRSAVTASPKLYCAEP
uniref:Uncharacterized protein n=1 Tax=Brugia malayi TaxID=6279 RepID=A8QBR8_BRUMA